jgi:methylthioribulose-1-phosphate dehydratase
MCKAEVGHGSRGCSYIEGIARGDKDNLDGLDFWRQETIVVGGCEGSARRRIATLHLLMVPDMDSLALAAESLCATARWCYTQGWVPATSGNFSVRAAGRILVTASGLDKGVLTPAGLLEVDFEGRVVRGEGKPSAETGLHLVLYKARPAAGAILHVHTVWNTLLSGIHEGEGLVAIAGYELLKGLSGVSTHEHVERVPILRNSQDYSLLKSKLADALKEFPEAHGVLLSRHGLYTWGESVADARRHLEALEFLFEVEGRRALG